MTSVDLSCELVLKAKKFRVGAEVLLLEAVESAMESNLSEMGHLCLVSKEMSGQCPLISRRESHSLSIPLVVGQRLDKK